VTSRSRFLPAPVVDWGILVAVLAALATGLVGLVVGRPSGAWVFVVHGVAGLALVPLLALKLARVAPRLRPDRLTPGRGLSVLLAVVALATLGTGIAWVHGAAVPLSFWRLLNVHILFGLLLAPLAAWHLRTRWRSPGSVARTGDRRAALRYAGIVLAGALTWRLQGAANAVLGAPDRRFTGSREDGSGDGNEFPVTAWVADDPDPVDVGAWTLSVGGLVERPLELAYADLDSTDGAPADGGSDSNTAGAGSTDDAGAAPAGVGVVDGPGATERATLDCTSGWYSVHDWGGVRVGDLLDAAGADDGAAWVQFRSVTGYRWSLPLSAAREALLATHVDGERLAHGHGAPLRLVAPGRRGFQWVKWVEAVEVRRRRELGELAAIFVSGFGGDE
jgi:DMSO/TMAO reductase YedYZ molybdopterin-dependent catalytic subunit